MSAHKDVLAGADFFTVEVLTLRGLVTYYVLFFIHLKSRRVSVAGITRHRIRGGWSRSSAARPRRPGHLQPCRYVLHDRDTKFCAVFGSTLADGGVKTIRLPREV
jgi:putative transposase